MVANFDPIRNELALLDEAKLVHVEVNVNDEERVEEPVDRVGFNVAAKAEPVRN